MSAESETDEAAVGGANERFYRALSDLSLEEMDRIWLHGRESRCIHPGWDVLVGWRAIRESWRSIFGASPGLSVEATDVEIHVYGEVGLVHCLENIHGSGVGGEPISLARATNLYLRSTGGWKMVLHHASPVPMMDEDAGTGAVH
jgi:SnoaL-like protein